MKINLWKIYCLLVLSQLTIYHIVHPIVFAHQNKLFCVSSLLVQMNYPYQKLLNQLISKNRINHLTNRHVINTLRRKSTSLLNITLQSLNEKIIFFPFLFFRIFLHSLKLQHYIEAKFHFVV